MAEKLEFRALRADEVQVRFAQLNNKQDPTGVQFLLYKDARCDMRILDEKFGAFGWSREHKMLDGKLYCSVSIFNEATNSWVTKDDAGEETQIAEAKGEASDAFKRACFNWGIGRELYTAPKKIEIPFENDFERQKQNIFGLYVSEMVVNDHRIDKLVISDKYKPRFTWTRQGVSVTPQASKSPLDYPLPATPHATMHRVGSGEKAKPIPTQEPKQFSSKNEAITTVKNTLPRLKSGDDLVKLWDLYPLYQTDVDFKALFTARKKELGIQ